jgi:phenylalanyl-tRNA synthetase beta chain
MPTILVDPDDLSWLAGERIDPEHLTKFLDLVKGEFKGREPDGSYRIELNDTNRPDLWTTEGIARQIRSSLGSRREYPFFGASPVGEIIVEPGLEKIRPYVGAFVVEDLQVSEKLLVQLIQTQEKLAENLGRKRRALAIGIYNLRRICFPVYYRPQDPDSHSYTPLGCDRPLSLRQILEQHPKGQQYGQILAGLPRVPLLIDRNGMTLSMPPIVNSRDTGQVAPGDSDLFVEATGTDLELLVLALNIMACDFSDRGGKVRPVKTRFAHDTPLGREVTLPRRLDYSLELKAEDFSRLLGVEIRPAEVMAVLERYGCDVAREGERLKVFPPPVRADYLHPVDVIEDFAIARGYQTFSPRLPQDFTVGRFDALSLLEERVRELMVGLGYEELISNILVSRQLVAGNMLQPDKKLVEVANPVSDGHCVLRDSLLPSLLQAEAASATATYPHRLFECGEVAVFDENSPIGSQTRMRLGLILAQRQAGVSECHSDVEQLAWQMGWSLKVQAEDMPLFLPGRSARLVDGAGRPAGIIGELHPAVLEKWGIAMPVAAAEIDLTALQGAR